MATERDTPRPLAEWLVVLTWALALAAVLLAPSRLGSTSPGDDLTRHTVRLALAYYAAALVLMMYSGRADRRAVTMKGRLARWCWTLAWATYLVHLAMAFHHYHHWSHAAAVEHTEQVSGLGAGIWVSHCFTLVWSLDVAAWWLAPGRRARRSPWVDGLLHGFMLFVVCNATVVYESGLIRWAGVAGFAALGLLAWARWGRGGPHLLPQANTSIPLSAGGGNSSWQCTQSSRSRGASLPQAGHDSSTGQDLPKR
jgi:hypothetical protein